MWNQADFGHVQRSRDLKLSLQGIMDIKHRYMILAEVSQWRRKEEILWRQRSRVDFLRYEYSNSKWFHTQATTRGATNVILHLLDEDRM